MILIYLMIIVVVHITRIPRTYSLASTSIPIGTLRPNYLEQKIWVYHDSPSLDVTAERVPILPTIQESADLIESIADADQLKIDEFLMLQDPELFPSRTCTKRQLRRGMVLINNLPATTSSILSRGDMITLISRFRANDRTSEGSQQRIISTTTNDASIIEVCYEDDYLAIVNKPFGIPVFPTSGSSAVSTQLLSILKPVSSEVLDPLNKPQPVHRIDRDTGGLLLIAKTRGALTKLSSMFSNRNITKRYIAVCYGSFPDLFNNLTAVDCVKSINIPIGGKYAHTEFSVTDQSYSREYGTISTLNVSLHTGRKHQIRRHLDIIGHPLVGEKVYWFSGGGLRKPESILRKISPRYPHLLFSSFIQFKHPCCTNANSVVTVQVNLEEPSLFKQIKSRLQSNDLYEDSIFAIDGG